MREIIGPVLGNKNLLIYLTEIEEKSEREFKLESPRDDLLNDYSHLNLLLPNFRRFSIGPVGDSDFVETFFRRMSPPLNSQRLSIIYNRLTSPGRKPYGIVFSADRNFLPQVVAAIGSCITFNPSYHYYFFDSAGDETVNHKLRTLGVNIVDINSKMTESRFNFKKIISSKFHLAVARKILSRLIAVSNGCCDDCSKILFADADLIFRGGLEEIFEDLESDIGTCVDWIQTPKRIQPLFPGRENEQYTSSVLGVLEKYPERHSGLGELLGTTDLSNLANEPYFNSGVMFLQRNEKNSSLFRDCLERIDSAPQAFQRIYPWPEQALLNILTRWNNISIQWLESSIWNFQSSKTKIYHMFGSSGLDLRGYEKLREEVTTAWSIIGENYWPKAKNSSKKLFFGWCGEFGWEITKAFPMVNALRNEYEVTVSTFGDAGGLYSGLDVDVIDNGLKTRRSTGIDRELPIPEQFRDGYEILVFRDNMHLDSRSTVAPGPLKPAEIRPDIEPDPKNLILIHARRNFNTSFRNWRFHQNSIVDYIKDEGFQVASIGSKDASIYLPGTIDKRSIPLGDLIRLMKNSCLVIGPLSGPSHLAQFCRVPIFVWSCRDDRCFPDTKAGIIWNPLKTPHFHPWWTNPTASNLRKYHTLHYSPSTEELKNGLKELLPRIKAVLKS